MGLDFVVVSNLLMGLEWLILVVVESVYVLFVVWNS